MRLTGEPSIGFVTVSENGFAAWARGGRILVGAPGSPPTIAETHPDLTAWFDADGPHLTWVTRRDGTNVLTVARVTIPDR